MQRQRLLTIAAVLAVVNALIAIVVSTIAVPYHVTSGSMLDTLRKGDVVLVAARGWDDIKRGSIVVFDAPDRKGDGTHVAIKRVIATTGDHIEARDGIIAVNRKDRLRESYLYEDDFATDIDGTQLPSDEVFLMGDNRNNSRDSRAYGPIAVESVHGPVVFRIWPLSRLGRVD